MTTVLFPVLLAAIYGITMKVADLLDEHGLKLFKGSDILFGIMWGTSGAAIILFTDPVIASCILAMNVAFICRNRLDYLNHQIAATIIIAVGLVTHIATPGIFLVFLALFLVFGGLKDYADDILHSRTWFGQVAELMLYYPLPTFLYCILYGNWMLFGVFTTYTIAYNATKLIARRYGYQ